MRYALRLYNMICGGIDISATSVDPGADPAERVVVPVHCHLIEHPEGIVLYDTGMSPDAIGDHVWYWGRPIAGRIAPVYKREETVMWRLGDLGYRTDQVEIVVNSHLHLDHAGCNRFFAKASFPVHPAELAAARAQEGVKGEAYTAADWKHPLSYVERIGDYDLFGDGAVRVISTPGHSAGHQSLAVRLANTGTVILTGDCCNQRWVFDRIEPPASSWERREHIASIKKLRALHEAEGGLVLVSHDPAQVREEKIAPAYYD
jgi:glyoxylase-like metal-dependent hydrolase (beta-lactamase superfamily II)